MKLEKYRNFNYEEILLNIPHPFVQYKKIKFSAVDNSKIVLDLAIPKSKIKGVIIDFPEFKVKNKDYLNLAKYSMLGYIIVSYTSEVKLETVKIKPLVLISHSLIAITKNLIIT